MILSTCIHSFRRHFSNSCGYNSNVFQTGLRWESLGNIFWLIKLVFCGLVASTKRNRSSLSAVEMDIIPRFVIIDTPVTEQIPAGSVLISTTVQWITNRSLAHLNGQCSLAADPLRVEVLCGMLKMVILARDSRGLWCHRIVTILSSEWMYHGSWRVVEPLHNFSSCFRYP